jgi:hypothetical protein
MATKSADKFTGTAIKPYRLDRKPRRDMVLIVAVDSGAQRREPKVSGFLILPQTSSITRRTSLQVRN